MPNHLVIYRLFFKAVLQWIPAEAAHRLAASTLRFLTSIPGGRALLRKVLGPNDPRLQVKALGLTFPNPLGVAGGMDKDATWFESLGALGFGFVEVGTVTAQPQQGTHGVRVWRLSKDRALLNRMGFPNDGATAISKRLRGRTGQVVVGANVGKSAIVAIEGAGDDYRESVRQLAPESDFIVLNISSPNTPRLQEMQEDGLLRALVADVRAELRSLRREIPLLIKISPDLTNEEIDAIAELAIELGLDGVVATNTTVRRDGLVADRTALEHPGGISGAPLKARALEVLQRLHAKAGGKLVLISVGGIETAADAWARILAGATLVQAHTAFVYGGPLWPRRINRGLSDYLDAGGFGSLTEAVGADAGSSNGAEESLNGGPPYVSPAPDQVPAGTAAMMSRPPRVG